MIGRILLLAAALALPHAPAAAEAVTAAMPSPPPIVIAHRGASGLAPENTLPAFLAAIRAGADGVELDVHLTADGVAVVHHDFRLSKDIARIEGRWLADDGPAIRSLTLAELERYDVGRIDPASNYARRYPDYAPSDGARAPTLAAVLDLIRREAPPDFQVWVELKADPTQPAISSDPAALSDAAARAVAEAGLMDRTTFISFHWPALYRLRDTVPAARLGFLSAERSWMDNVQLGRPGVSPWVAALDIDDLGGSIPQAIAELGGEAWSVYYKDLTPERLAEARALGLQVGVWTVRDAEQREAAAALAPDVITTDRPDWYRQE